MNVYCRDTLMIWYFYNILQINFSLLDTFSFGCPIEKPKDWKEALLDGKDGGLNEEHGKNFVCRYLSFLDRDVVTPGNH